MAAHPWVRTVEVTRRFPSGVSVEVVEHVPAALAVLGDLYLVDEEGEPFKRLQPGDALDLPLVTGLDREGYLADEAQTRERFREALEVARAYAATEPGKRERLSEVRLTAERADAGDWRTGQEVRLGEGETGRQAAAARARARGAARARRWPREVIHLDNRARPGWVAVKLSSPVSERTRGRRSRNEPLSREWGAWEGCHGEAEVRGDHRRPRHRHDEDLRHRRRAHRQRHRHHRHRHAPVEGAAQGRGGQHRGHRGLHPPRHRGGRADGRLRDHPRVHRHRRRPHQGLQLARASWR